MRQSSSSSVRSRNDGMMTKRLTAETAEQATATQGRFRFRIVHVIYAVTLLAASSTTFGIEGILLAAVIGVLWAFILRSRSRSLAGGRTAMYVFFVGSCLFGLMVPATSRAPQAARRMQCTNNIKQIARGLHRYHAQYGSFPPAFVAGDDGQPAHSWRVLLLPFIDQQTLYAKYSFAEPWNGPHNKKLAQQIPFLYSCPTAEFDTKVSGCCNYLAVVGTQTPWPNESSSSISQITDGSSRHTILLVEFPDQQIQWLEPRDLAYDEALRLLSAVDSVATGHRARDFFHVTSAGRHVAFVDGSVGFIPHGVNRQLWTGMLNPHDGAAPVSDDWDLEPIVENKPRLDNWLRLSIFIVVVLFPLPWIWITPRKSRHPR